MDTLFFGIVIFLIVLAVFDLVVGVSNDAVNFLNSAIGAKVARFRTIVLIAAIGVFAGAAMSNGMMDVARHGIMTPEYFSFYDVMCVFLAVMVTDVILLDVFNTLGMPTSTTVSMVFELLGGAFAIALIQIIGGATDADGVALTLGDLLNTEKALSVILGIFLSVGIAFAFGTLVQWIARIIFTFTYRPSPFAPSRKGREIVSFVKQTLFGGICFTSIIWFLLINGLKGSSLMTSDLKLWINENTWMVLGITFCAAFLVSALLYLLPRPSREGARGEGLPVLKFVVLLGTFALAMAFAGNDLVNFVGVPLTGLDAYNDYMANGQGDASAFMMKSLMDTAHTPVIYLILAGVVMVLSLVFSKKAQNVVKTSVDLARQDEGDEMFGSSGIARILVRTSQRIANAVSGIVPKNMSRWIDSRFNSYAAFLEKDAAFDHIRASVNLVLAGLLVAFGTSMKLPLSTTYVTFMVAMGTSLADRAWSRESAVFRITGVLSVIGGWFITAGVAFIMCYLITNVLFYGSFIAMGIAIIVAIFLLVRSNVIYKKRGGKRKQKEEKREMADDIFRSIIRSSDKKKCYEYLCEHMELTTDEELRSAIEHYETLTTAFFHEDYRTLKKMTTLLEDERKEIKRLRRKQVIALRRVDPMVSVEKGTWYFLVNSSLSQIVYCLKRMAEPCREHVGNNFHPVPEPYVRQFMSYRDEVIHVFRQALTSQNVEDVRNDAASIQAALSDYRKSIIQDLQTKQLNIESMTVFLSLVQESQELLSGLRHTIRGEVKFKEN
ncbi:MAG: inorganic phosphate transporter [Prevotellaceae bacterium]|nr:inorganic phosphate transporter [Candidatus Minthosoma equi]